ncbi:MAG TPA: EVE domain-containing protein [Methanothermobacter sp.]|nr:EVE domain-containing protein [Methanothermobacter sp.]
MDSYQKVWTFTIRKNFYFSLKEKDEFTWNSAKEVKKGDLILIYAGDPYKNIGFILKAISDPFEDSNIREKWNRPAVSLKKIIEIPKPIELSELRDDPTLSDWGAVRFNFRKSHWKMKDEEWFALKKLILSKNPELQHVLDPQKNIKFLKLLYEKFTTEYLNTPTGQKHKEMYDKEKLIVNELFNKTLEKLNKGEDITELVLKKLLPLKGNRFTTIPAGFTTFKAFGISEEQQIQLSNDLVSTLIELKNNIENSDTQKELLIDLQNKYPKGVKTGVVSAAIYFLEPYYLLINKKTEKTYNFLTKEFLPEYRTINNTLADYITNIENLKKLLQEINDISLGFSDYPIFDIFCHWMCEESLGNYAVDSDKYLRWVKTQKRPNDIIKNYLEDLLNNYQKAKQKKVNENEILRVKDIIATRLPTYLENITNQNTFSSASAKWHYCPYVAIMNPEVSTKHNEGFFVNYMLTEDMSGVYIALRQGVDDINKGDQYKNQLRLKANKFRKKIKPFKITSQFSEETDLKSIHSSHAPFYEAATIYSKFYEKGNLPSEDELRKDLNNILLLYDALAENKFLNFMKDVYTQEIQIALGELERGKNVIFYGPPGSGKTVLSKIISEKYFGKDGYSLYTVHSGTDYYDLVCRIVPQIDDQGNLIYSKERRFLLDALLSGKVLILDEINRTQIDTALGIFFTYLERDHRINDVEQIRNILKNEIDEEFEFDELKQMLADFRIIGTLNVYDKTFLFKLGDALKRRFTFIEITTKPELASDLTINHSFKDKFTRICGYKKDQSIADSIINVFVDLNHIKPLGIGILKEALQFSQYFPNDEAVDLSVSSLIVPFFENDLNYSTIKNILEKYTLNNSIRKLESLNFGTSDVNGF